MNTTWLKTQGEINEQQRLSKRNNGYDSIFRIPFNLNDFNDGDVMNIRDSYKLDGILKKTKLEIALDNCNHTMELVRTIVPILVLIIQVIILFKI